MDKIDVSKLTPMMQQYINIKKENEDSIVFYRLGDFYEMFFDDAILAAKELELALTSRDCGLKDRAPMAGIPHHVVDTYIKKLVDKGYKIALVDQMEDPKQAKGIVKRGVSRIISPGTLVELDGNHRDNNFLLSIYFTFSAIGISYIDISTGEMKATEIKNSENIERDLLDFVVKIEPKEIIFNKEIVYKNLKNYINNKNIFTNIIDSSYKDIESAIQSIKNKFKSINIKDIENRYFALIAAANLLDYVYLYREDKLVHITEITYITNVDFMKLDASTRENLEIHRNLNDGSKKFTLLKLLDKAKTPMGSRKINSWLEFPLINLNSIEYRLDLSTYLFNNPDTLRELRAELEGIYDLERLLGKISYKRVNARDFLMLKNSLFLIPKLKDRLKSFDDKNFAKIARYLDDLNDIYALIEKSIREDSPNQITEGGIIKHGYNSKLDNLKNSSVEGERLLLEYEIELKEKTKIKTLKIAYNKNTGYYIELTKSNISQAPKYFVRRQTLKNSERYITEKLNQISDMILGSQEELIEFEYNLFVEIRDLISDNSSRIKSTAETIAFVDAIASLAYIAKNNSYSRPIFNTNNEIIIKDGRHPIIEKTIGINEFIANDCNLGEKGKIIQLITGPNMAGKSTYMRQVALTIIMAQIGSYVPSRYANLPIVKSLFSRIGASDNLAKGDSTFMVEMKEMSNIIKNSDENSFVILDEVGRGTSNNDGYSIAKSIVEYMASHNKSKVLFATHYHELTHLEETIDSLENLKVEILEENGNLIFLRKIMKGKANKSYGIEVAKLSGLPDEVIIRANNILSSIDDNKISESSPVIQEARSESIEQDIFLRSLAKINVDEITPMEGLNKLYEMKRRAGDLIND